uniref:Uncharacterized protein n=1 Tax=Cyclophora tenuis TaxID=216820 RepID=A0A6U1RZB9_CYCTE
MDGTTVEAFTTIQPLSIGVCRSSSCCCQEDIIRLREQPDEWQGFNPFQPKGSGSFGSGRTTGSIGGNIGVFNIRKAKMEKIMAELLSRYEADEETAERKEGPQVVDNKQKQEEKILATLRQHQEFLIEPLENDDAVLDPDSIYAPGMDRTQRYQIYRQEMQKRIDNARYKRAKHILQTMMTFVLSFE